MLLPRPKKKNFSCIIRSQPASLHVREQEGRESQRRGGRRRNSSGVISASQQNWFKMWLDAWKQRNVSTLRLLLAESLGRLQDRAWETVQAELIVQCVLAFILAALSVVLSHWSPLLHLLSGFSEAVCVNVHAPPASACAVIYGILHTQRCSSLWYFMVIS